MREAIAGWRFYDHLRTDPHAPARQRNVGSWAPVLDVDGSNLASALQTIIESDNERDLAETIDDAFPGSRLWIDCDGPRFGTMLQQPGLLRPLEAEELSDGTLRYLMLAAALHTPRPPELMVLNEPETSLHPDLLPALARMLVKAAGTTQIWVVTHSAALSKLLATAGAVSIVLDKNLGQTEVQGVGLLDRPPWEWQKRSI